MRHAIRDHVGANAAQPDDHCALADAHELAHRHAAAEHDMIADRDVTAENSVVGEHHMVADLAIMRDMRADHEKTAVANFGDAAAVLGAGVHGDVFADIAIGADHQPGRPAAIAERLRRRTKRSKRMNDGARTDCGVAGEIDMRDQSATVADAHMRADSAIRTD